MNEEKINEERINEKVLKILQEINPYEEINEESRLIEDAILDSLTLVLLISEIEGAFQIKIPEDKLQPELFENIPMIVKLINELM